MLRSRVRETALRNFIWTTSFRILNSAKRWEIAVHSPSLLHFWRRLIACLQQHARRTDPGCDLRHRVFSPSQIECCAFREERDRVVVEMIVHPPCKVPPVPARLVVSGEPWNDDRTACAQVSLGVPSVPDMRRSVSFVRRAIEPVAGTEVVDLRRSVGRAYLDWSEGLDERLEQCLCQPPAGLNREIAVFG